ncbi:CAP domain-containing protein [Xylariaceae sp. FL0255]|nr:CAP domain-containing protein [Xylariaceae sp. FL0255]
MFFLIFLFFFLTPLSLAGILQPRQPHRDNAEVPYDSLEFKERDIHVITDLDIITFTVTRTITATARASFTSVLTSMTTSTSTTCQKTSSLSSTLSTIETSLTPPSSASVSSPPAAGSPPEPSNAVPTACSTKVATFPGLPPPPKPTSQFNVTSRWVGDDFPFYISDDKAPFYKDSDYVTLHNMYRALHGVGNLTRNSSLEASAQSYLTGKECPNGDPAGAPGGSNWYAFSSMPIALNQKIDFQDATSAWYGERSNYTAASADFLCDNVVTSKKNSAGEMVNLDVGHFTQMVWNATTSVGCAKAYDCSNGLPVQILCFYYPPGNMYENGSEMSLYNVFRPSQ